MQKIYSKKNKVKRLNGKVVKCFNSDETFDLEVKILKALDVHYIEHVDTTNKCIEMTDLQGTSLLEIMESCERANKSDKLFRIFMQCFDALDDFHKKLDYVYRFRDVNFRNFIVDKKVTLIDYGDVSRGDYKLDYIDFVGMFLMYNPIGSSFKRRLGESLKDLLIKQFDFDTSDYDLMLEESIAIIKHRRCKK